MARNEKTRCVPVSFLGLIHTFWFFCGAAIASIVGNAIMLLTPLGREDREEFGFIDAFVGCYLYIALILIPAIGVYFIRIIAERMSVRAQNMRRSASIVSGTICGIAVVGFPLLLSFEDRLIGTVIACSVCIPLVCAEISLHSSRAHAAGFEVLVRGCEEADDRAD